MLTGQSGTPERFYAHAGGRPTALVFAGADDDPRLLDLVGRLRGRDDVALCIVAPGPAGGSGGERRWSDPDGAVAAAYGITAAEPTAVVLDANLRVLGVTSGAESADAVIGLLDGALDVSPPAEVIAQAPVLLLPRALDRALAERLIQVWETADTRATGVQRSEGEEQDTSYKLRRDHTVTDPDLLRELSTAVGARVMPEVRKAFAFRATRFEGFKIACYDGSTGGFFRAHRDNLSPATAHRVFALTLNLNDDYEGGQLRFPEYGTQLYRPAAGTALVFSCAHLHEVMDVTAGRRFVLLSFLYAEPDQ